MCFWQISDTEMYWSLCTLVIRKVTGLGHSLQTCSEVGRVMLSENRESTSKLSDHRQNQGFSSVPLKFPLVVTTYLFDETPLQCIAYERHRLWNAKKRENLAAGGCVGPDTARTFHHEFLLRSKPNLLPYAHRKHITYTLLFHLWLVF